MANQTYIAGCNIYLSAATLKRAEMLVASAGSQTALEEAQHMLRHSSAKLQVARLKKRHHR